VLAVAVDLQCERSARSSPSTTPHDEGEGDRSYHDIASIPQQLDGVVIATMPAVAESLVADGVTAGVPRVRPHRGIGPGSMSDKAVAACREHGLAVIPGDCPNMFG
jgi:uncharacterized protein